MKKLSIILLCVAALAMVPANYAEAVKAITAETVQSTLKKLVDSGNVFEVVMLPE